MISKQLKGLLLFLFLLVFGLAFTKNVSASRGTIDMRSTNSEDYRCYASSLIAQNNRFDVAINCVNLIFPINPPEVLTYVVWANPVNGKNPIRLGDLQKGVVRFEIQQPFTSLFVTVEANANVRNPSANTVMRGEIEPISFLEKASTPTPTPEVKETDGNGEKQPASTTQLSTREKLLLALRRAGIAAIIALVAIVGLVFVVTRSRG